MAIAEPQTTSKKEDDEISLADSDDMGVDDDAAFALPPTKIEIDPSTGIKTVTEYRAFSRLFVCLCIYAKRFITHARNTISSPRV